MQYKQFTITNFRGIRRLEIDLGQDPSSPIVTLVGLNESGKTTIFEALFFFFENIGIESEDTLHRGIIDALHTLIPKRLKDNFNDIIQIEVCIELGSTGKEIIKRVCRNNKFRISELGEELTIKHEYRYKDSKHVKTNKYWDIHLIGKPPKGRKDKPVSSRMAVWTHIVAALKSALPPIIYYPNFLFDFPDRIYLEESDGESREQVFYRRLIQDILDSFENELTIEDHLVRRAKSESKDDADALDSVVNKMGVRVTRLIFDPEFSVFQQTDKNKSLVFSTPFFDEDDRCYLEIKLRDGEDSFFIHERSLGFRWFFTFLLFTQYRVRRQTETAKPVFLFDEPASNLHQTAQARLLRAFEQLTEKYGSRIVYSTHSHHLINPRWLESMYIVKNNALSYTEDDRLYTPAMTDITVEKYRSFVANHPDQRTYFQPVLDVLEYVPSLLENVPSVVMVEGKNDFYTLSLVSQLLGYEEKIHLLPGGGSGSLDSVIQLYIAWGRKFIVLLDSDSEGETQKRRYNDKFGMTLADRVVTLTDLVLVQKGARMENLFSFQERQSIQSKYSGGSKKFNKKHFYLSIQEHVINHDAICLEQKTEDSFRSLLEKLEKLLE